MPPTKGESAQPLRNKHKGATGASNFDRDQLSPGDNDASVDVTGAANGWGRSGGNWGDNAPDDELLSDQTLLQGSRQKAML